MATFDEAKQKKKIEALREKEEEQVTQLLADKYGIPYANLKKAHAELDYLKLIPEEKSREGKTAVFRSVGKKIQVAVQNPNLEMSKNLIKELERKGYQIQTFLVSLSSLEKIWEQYREIPKFEEFLTGAVDISAQQVERFLSEITGLEEFKQSFITRAASRKKRRTSELLAIILGGSLKVDASDIHLEPYEKGVKMRLRLDGVLHEVLEFNFASYKLLLSRIKLISGMKLNIREKAQDGRFTIKARGTEVEIRASILPSPYGETIVLRILNPKAINVPLEKLGMSDCLREIVEKEIKKPNGMILTTGPTGSGKTTTLYAFLKKVNSPDIKIITVEEPVEYHLKGITQTQTKPEKGYAFSTALRSIVRQDPDIIMVGEIRDGEAAEIALNAALTGHLVFSSLHTNDAAGTIPRLVEMEAKPNIIAPAVNLAIAQRLVRKLCAHCKKERTPSKDEKEMIKRTIDSLPKNIKRPKNEKFNIYEAGQCEKCNNLGYKGRVGVFEAIKIDDAMEKLILTNPSEAEIKEAAGKQGIPNLQQDAILKVLEGITSLEEIKRVVEIS